MEILTKRQVAEMWVLPLGNLESFKERLIQELMSKDEIDFIQQFRNECKLNLNVFSSGKYFIKY